MSGQTSATSAEAAEGLSFVLLVDFAAEGLDFSHVSGFRRHLIYLHSLPPQVPRSAGHCPVQGRVRRVASPTSVWQIQGQGASQFLLQQRRILL